MLIDDSGFQTSICHSCLKCKTFGRRCTLHNDRCFCVYDTADVIALYVTADCKTFGRRCTLHNDRCFCVFETADGIEPTWLQADTFCRERTGGKLLEISSQEEAQAVAGIILDSGRYWTGLTSQKRYEFYGKHRDVGFCSIEFYWKFSDAVSVSHALNFTIDI